MLIYNCLNVLIVCISFRLRFICVSFAYQYSLFVVLFLQLTIISI